MSQVAEDNASTVEYPRPGGRIGKYRWWIVALLFFATTINYIDRQVVSLVKDNITTAFAWPKDQKEVLYSYVVVAFQATYALGYLLGGRLTDVIGIKRGYAIAVSLWSLMGVLTGFVTSTVGMCFARGGLGFAEGGNFPSAIKTVSEWFPARERALATGIFNAGSNFGPILTPLIVPPLVLAYGWQSAFIVTGAIGAIWVVAWLALYKRPEEQPNLGVAELEYIRSDPPEPESRTPWLQLLSYRAVWAYVLGTMLTAPIWWFYLFWAPDFFKNQFSLNISTVGLPLVAIYVFADIGSVGGGWLSSFIIKRGASVNTGRKIGLLACALCVVPVFLASQVPNEFAAIGILGLALAAHQGWSANLYTFASDTMPRASVSSIVGMGGFAGGIVSIFFSLFVGEWLKRTHSYGVILALCPVGYLAGFAIMHLLVPKIGQTKSLQESAQA